MTQSTQERPGFIGLDIMHGPFERTQMPETGRGKRSTTSRIAVATIVLSLLPAAAVFAQNYPTKPIRLIVPNAPGGGSDLVARLLAAKFSQSPARQMIVENREGASGQVGVGLVIKSPPDGYTLLMGTSGNLITSPALNPRLSYKSPADFAPISLLGQTTFVLVVHPSVPARSVKDLIAIAKSKPGALNYASAGNGSPTHLVGELFKSLTGTTILHVPYKGSAPGLVSVTKGETDFIFGNLLPATPLIAARRVRALGIASLKRSSLMPELPTLNESGVPGFDVRQFYAVLAPAGTRSETVAWLNQEFGNLMNAADTKASLARDGSEVVTSTPEELEKLIIAEIAKWAALIKSAGIRGE